MPKKIPHAYRKIAEMLNDDSRRIRMSRVSLERKISSQFRLKRLDMDKICKELESYGILRKKNSDGYEIGLF